MFFWLKNKNTAAVLLEYMAVNAVFSALVVFYVVFNNWSFSSGDTWIGQWQKYFVFEMKPLVVCKNWEEERNVDYLPLSTSSLILGTEQILNHFGL